MGWGALAAGAQTLHKPGQLGGDEKVAARNARISRRMVTYRCGLQSESVLFVAAAVEQSHHHVLRFNS
jgi:hypothetical protein